VSTFFRKRGFRVISGYFFFFLFLGFEPLSASATASSAASKASIVAFSSSVAPASLMLKGKIGGKLSATARGRGATMQDHHMSIDKRYLPQIVDRQISADGARKYVMRLHDGALVEAVGMPRGGADGANKLTVCFSTQSGCAMGCAFCVTGKLGLTRNLEPAEMVWQAALVADDFGISADSVLAMGQGEPLANYAALAEALGFMSSAQGFGIEQRNLVVSTCGIPEGIRAFAEDGVPAALAVSLHAARQELRDELMPGVRAYTLERLRRELVRYNEVTGKHVYVHYLMLDSVNDQDADFEALAEFCRGLDARVVLMHFNRTDDVPFAPSAFGRMFMWCIELNKRGIPVRINESRGADVNAGCGQLAGTMSRKMQQ